MFLIDKYQNISNEYISKNEMIEKILNCFNTHNNIYRNIDEIIKKTPHEFIKTIVELEKGVWKFANFQHLIVYGSLTTNKEYLVNLLLEKIYGKKYIELKEVEYTISGY
jgi:hypothetical protein